MKNHTLYNKINPITYGVAKLACKIYCKFGLNLKILRNELKGSKGAKIILCNHESAYDFMPLFTASPEKVHAVMSSSILRSLPVYNGAIRCGVIGKNQFSTLPTDLKKMKAVLDDGKTLCLFPCGLMPEGGVPTPMPKATAKAVKWFGVDVYIAKLRGQYLTKPKWSNVVRKGKCFIDIYKLCSANELSNLTIDEAQRLIENHLDFDAYRNNEIDKIEYKNGDNIVGLENVLYICPHCKKEYTIKPDNHNVLTCSNCGYSVKSDKLGLLHQNGDKPLIYKYVSDWFRFVESIEKDYLLSCDNFNFSTNAEIHKINDKKHKFEKVGNGKITLDKNTFTIDGVLYNNKFYKQIFACNFPTLPCVPGKRFEIQDGADIYRIYPENPKTVMKWLNYVKALYKK